MSDSHDNVTHLATERAARDRTGGAEPHVHVLPAHAFRARGDIRVTVADEDGVLFGVVLTHDDLRQKGAVIATGGTGSRQFLISALAGALNAFAGQ